MTKLQAEAETEHFMRLLLFILTAATAAAITAGVWEYAAALGLTPCVDGAPVRGWDGCEHPDQRAPDCVCSR